MVKTLAFNRAIHNCAIDKRIFKYNVSIFQDAKDDMDIFVKDVCSLSYQMLCLNPPMEFLVEGLGASPSETTQEILPSPGMKLSKMDDMNVQCYLEPTMKHGSLILRKGRVVLQIIIVLFYINANIF